MITLYALKYFLNKYGFDLSETNVDFVSVNFGTRDRRIEMENLLIEKGFHLSTDCENNQSVSEIKVTPESVRVYSIIKEGAKKWADLSKNCASSLELDNLFMSILNSTCKIDTYDLFHLQLLNSEIDRIKNKVTL